MVQDMRDEFNPFYHARNVIQAIDNFVALPFGPKAKDRFSAMTNMKGSSTNICSAKLYDDAGQLILNKTFAPIHMQNGDSLELKWNLDCTGGSIVSRRHITLNDHMEKPVSTLLPESDDSEFDEAVNNWWAQL
jgi:hypothetical protein